MSEKEPGWDPRLGQTNLLARIVELATESIVVTDSDSRIIYVNQAFERLTGYSRQEALGQNPIGLMRSRANEPRLHQELDASLARGEAWSGRLVNRRKDGTLFQEDLTVVPILGSGGEIVHFFSVARDVTQMVSLEAQLLQAQRLETIGTLAGGIAHDFNNILGSILGFAELVRDDIAPETLSRANIEEVIRGCLRARDLVRRLLTFSSVQAGERTLTALDGVANEALELIPPSLTSNLVVQRRFAPNLPPILADPTQIHQLVANLCTNACQAMHSAGGVLEVGLQVVRHEAGEPPGLDRPCVRLWVSDTGPGIDPALLGRVFDPFFTTRPTGMGTGLGLSVVHGIVEDLGGAISATNRPRGGALFQVWLPFPAGAEPGSPAPAQPPARGIGTLLLVDDEVDLLHAWGQRLRREGYEVIAHSKAAEALARVQKEPERFDLVVTDQAMPGLTGMDLAGLILQIRPDMPILICSGHGQGLTKAVVRRAGLRGFLRKPVPAGELSATIEKILMDGKGGEP